MEAPNLGKYMNLHLEIGAAPMHFIAMDTIEIRNSKSPYQYAFTLIDMLTNYVWAIPVKNISGKTLVHEYIYKVYLPFGRTAKFLSDNGTSFINEHWKNLANALAFKHFQSSPRNPRANGKIENVHNFLKRTLKKIMHSNPKIPWHEAIQIAAHHHNTFPSANNGHSPFLLHLSREDSNPLWNRLNPRNTTILQGDTTVPVLELHKLWKNHA
ncbi:MAG: transposase family protein, partial [Proteobacteria bacterium]|nr:transposase family protein [Pseudomonadota bacterium]